MLDDGRLTDGQGRTVDFRNTLIILTSNLGSEFMAQLADGTDVETIREPVMDAVRAAFRPEFLNRLDEVILFSEAPARPDGRHRGHPDGAPAEALLADRKVTLALDDTARAWLAEAGYDPAFGARPLKRVIQKAVQDPLAERILSGESRPASG